jgi:hypothetical protein
MAAEAKATVVSGSDARAAVARRDALPLSSSPWVVFGDD